jgi:predicted outer membrane repeat protein
MKRILLVVLSVLTLPVPALAVTYHVAPDGGGDFPTIQAALDAATDGDEIELSSGVFSGAGNRDLDFQGKVLALRSASGDPATCTLNCEGSEAAPHRGLRFHSGETSASLVDGITITNGFMAGEPLGGAIVCESASSPSIVSCVFSGNQGSAVVCTDACASVFTDCVFVGNAGGEGGAIRCDSSFLVINGCRFQENTANWNGGAFHGHASQARFSNCVFVGNTSAISGAVHLIFGQEYEFTGCRFTENSAGETGALMVFYCRATISGCTFERNTASSMSGGAISSGKMSYTYLRSCTFWGNGAPGGTLFLGELESKLDNCVVAFGTSGPALAANGRVTLSCCDLYGNPGGDWIGPLAGQLGAHGNIAQDPLFCEAENGDFTIRADSPCAPFFRPNPTCGLIGAWPVGCAATPVETTSWGALKAKFQGVP